MRLTLTAIAVATLGLGLSANASALGFGGMDSEVRNLSVDASGLTKFKAQVSAGDFRLVGDPSATEVSVKATAYAKDLDPDAVKILLTRQSDHVQLLADYDKDSWFSSGDGYIDIQVIVPQKMTLAIDDGSGDIVVSEVIGDVSVNDGSGNINLDVQGNVKVNDGSGDMRIHSPAYSVSINDGSGNITVSEANHLKVNDGSGDIVVDRVNGKTSISDGSGDIVVRSMSGGSISDGSGDIKVMTNNALLTISDGSGDIRVPDLVNVDIRGDGSGGVYVNGYLEESFKPKKDLRLK